MPRLLRRKLRCHYCNSSAQNNEPGIPRTWLCPHCDAVNYFDERGEITDPPIETTAAQAPLLYTHARSRSPTPVMSAPAESPFCDTCQRNQLLLNKTLAEYIPEEDEPDYKERVASVDQFRAELEERYPQVCENCVGRVQEQIRRAGYKAKADHLRRVLEQSKKYSSKSTTTRQLGTLAVIWVAKWTYIFSVVVGLFWHAFGTIIAPDDGMFDSGDFSWRMCLGKAVTTLQVPQACFLSQHMRELVKYALVADLLTLWWNPKLVQKTNRPGGRMRGLVPLWLMRILVLVLRYLSLRAWDKAELNYEGHLQFFHYTHGVLLAIMLISTIVGWKSVYIVYLTPASIRKPLDQNLPSAPNSAEKPARTGSQSVVPGKTSFDTMASSFTSSFPNGKLDEPISNYPPSPTLTSTSSSYDSDTGTPWNRKSSENPPDSMDWTPTQKRFASNAPSVLPSRWAQQSPIVQLTPPRKQHSLFSKPDPNPFRHKIPAAPKAPIQAKIDPWKPGVWAPPLKETTPNFFKEDQKKAGADRGLQGIGVPKNVLREAELFDKPKFKYDYYGKMKETGLEETFNNLFSK